MRYLFWLILLLLIFVRYISSRPNYSDGGRLHITTKISSEPIRYESSQYFKLAGLKVYIPLFPEVHYGDKRIDWGFI